MTTRVPSVDVALVAGKTKELLSVVTTVIVRTNFLNNIANTNVRFLKVVVDLYPRRHLRKVC